ncbi:hypothetical protein [Dietzia lutea]|uniref:Uncharacterized protein n=1 Tax=Dietzia lutea TaxID=546160 RepID=A0A2S1RB94_9ACTN|nr:hypothetical protein [Dietzia lutea]AWH93566.1 hypothetical protein A6035_16850 [Dietzia lutea]
MPHYRLHTPDQTIGLGEHETAQQALESAVSGHRETRPADGSLEVQVGEAWHSVDIEGDMP